MIAEHKSQGIMQKYMNSFDTERFFSLRSMMIAESSGRKLYLPGWETARSNPDQSFGRFGLGGVYALKCIV